MLAEMVHSVKYALESFGELDHTATMLTRNQEVYQNTGTRTRKERSLNNRHHQGGCTKPGIPSPGLLALQLACELFVLIGGDEIHASGDGGTPALADRVQGAEVVTAGPSARRRRFGRVAIQRVEADP